MCACMYEHDAIDGGFANISYVNLVSSSFSPLLLLTSDFGVVLPEKMFDWMNGNGKCLMPCVIPLN